MILKHLPSFNCLVREISICQVLTALGDQCRCDDYLMKGSPTPLRTFGMSMLQEQQNLACDATGSDVQSRQGLVARAAMLRSQVRDVKILSFLCAKSDQKPEEPKRLAPLARNAFSKIGDFRCSGLGAAVPLLLEIFCEISARLVGEFLDEGRKLFDKLVGSSPQLFKISGCEREVDR